MTVGFAACASRRRLRAKAKTMELDIQRIAKAVQGTFVVPARSEAKACGLSWDSRTVEPGWAYACIVGERSDGHDFALPAMRAGASLVLVTHDLGEEALEYAAREGVAVVRVADMVQALANIAAQWRDELAACVVGVTGSVGKTTTRSLIGQVLSARFATQATKGNFNNELGAPLTVMNTNRDTQMLVLEMGMDNLGQIAHIASFARPDMGVITNVGVMHLEYLKTRENIARAKAELLEALPDGSGWAFLNAADDMTDFVRAHARLDARGIRVCLYDGTPEAHDCMAALMASERKGQCAVWAEDIELDAQGCAHFTLCAQGFDADALHVQRCACALALRGLHNVSNACAAAAVGLVQGINLDAVASALGQAQPEAGRQELKHTASGAAVFDDSYNAGPDSMKASLAMLGAYACEGTRVAVLGDMGELGTASAEGHASVGVAAAQAGVDLLVCVGERARGIAQGAQGAGMSASCIVCVEDAAAAVAALDGRLGAHDVVLVKASHFMGLDRVVEGIIA